MTTATTYSFPYEQVWEEPETHSKEWSCRIRMELPDKARSYSSFHKNKQLLEELGEKNESELDDFPSELGREENALETTDQETVCEEESRKSVCSSAAVKKKRKKRSYGELQAFGRLKKHKTYICKPDSGCQGRGIFITRTVKDIKPGEDMICQLYISKPFIIDGFKFDLRVYVLVTSCDPLRVFVYNEGLARFATSAYSDPSNSNLDDVCMHLTNYSINKHSANFVRDEDSGSKRKLSTFNKYMEQNGYETEKIWKDIEDVVIKTLISAHPIIRHNYLTCFPNHTMWSACFEILGFDILLDRKLKPWLLEVNHSPSFNTDSWLDREVKDQLLYDTLVLINLGACDKRKVLEEEKRRGKERLFKQCRNREAREFKKASQPSATPGSKARGHSPVCGLSTKRAEENKNCQAAWLQQSEKYEEKNTGGYRRIYPTSDSERYDKFFQHNNSLFQETAASRAREEYARQLLQNLRLKQEQKATLLREKKAELQGESSGEKIKIARQKVVSRTRMVRVSAQPQVCSESGPGPTFLSEHFSDVQQPEKKVDSRYSNICQLENHGSNNCSEILEKLPVRPYSSVPDLSRGNSSNTPEQYNSTPELRDTISSHHSATDMSVRARLQLPDKFTKAHGKQSPCPHKHFPEMTQPRAKSVTATSMACQDGLAIKNFHPFEEDLFQSHLRGNAALSYSAEQTVKIKLPEKEQDERSIAVSGFFSKMSYTPVERNVRFLLQQQSHHFTNRAQSASLPRRILDSRSASCRRPKKFNIAHVPAQRLMVEHHSLQDLLMISRMKNQPQRTNDPSLGDSPVNKVLSNPPQTQTY